ncbi:MAG: response regulator transcription factor [Sphingomonadales bacterium]
MRILVADDHSLFREGCKFLLKELEPNSEVVEAGDFDEVRQLLESGEDFDLILIDLRMPGGNETENVRQPRKLAPTTPVVVISALDDPYYAQQAMNNGAAGYIPKSASNSVISSALKLILAGGSYVPPALMSAPAEAPVDSKDQNGLPGNLCDMAIDVLTPRQKDVMRYLAQGESNKAIADRLGLSEGTIKVHVAAILKALNVANRTQAVLIASGMPRV